MMTTVSAATQPAEWSGTRCGGKRTETSVPQDRRSPRSCCVDADAARPRAAHTAPIMLLLGGRPPAFVPCHGGTPVIGPGDLVRPCAETVTAPPPRGAVTDRL